MYPRHIARQEPDLDRILHGTFLGEGALAARVAILIADERGFYLAVNDEACALTGYSRDDLTTLQAGELAADEESRSMYLELLSGKRSEGRKLIRRHDDSLVECRYWGIQTAIARLPHFFVLLWPTATAPV